jgi:putative ABC transport system permease protein
VLRGDFTRGLGGLRMRNALVVLQFSLAIALLASTVVIHQQQRLAQTIDLGFDKDVIVIVPSAAPNGYRADWPAFKAALLAHSAIEGVTASHFLPFGFNDNQIPLRRAGTAIETRIQYMMVDYDFFETYGIDLLSGRLFSADTGSDALQWPTEENPEGRISFLLNRAAARALAIEPDVLTEETLEILQPAIAGPVHGVVEDTHFESIHRAARPLVFILTPPESPEQLQRMRSAAVRISLDNLDAALAHIDATWQQMYPNLENNRYFLDRNFQAMYQAEQKQGELFTAFSTLAIAIACFGLFGLASFNAERRTKEIGVRKVMGSSVWRIVLLLSNDFSKLVLVANVIAWPLAWVAMQRWLEQFAYRIDLTPMIFIGSGLIALCVAWVTVGGTAAKAAGQKPVLALRYE